MEEVWFVWRLLGLLLLLSSCCHLWWEVEGGKDLWWEVEGGNKEVLVLRQMLIPNKIVPELIAELVPEVLQIAFDFRDAAANILLFHTDPPVPVLPDPEMVVRDLCYI